MLFETSSQGQFFQSTQNNFFFIFTQATLLFVIVQLPLTDYWHYLFKKYPHHLAHLDLCIRLSPLDLTVYWNRTSAHWRQLMGVNPLTAGFLKWIYSFQYLDQPFYFLLRYCNKKILWLVNTVDPDQTAPAEEVWSRSTAFAKAHLTGLNVRRVKAKHP